MAYIGEKITSRESARRRAAGNVYIFHLNYHYAIDGQTLDNTARYINHSCDPNCVVEKANDTLWIVAARDITEGEELSYNYGYELTHYRDNPCNCGAAHCCGYILDRQYWGRIDQTSSKQDPRVSEGMDTRRDPKNKGYFRYRK